MLLVDKQFNLFDCFLKNIKKKLNLFTCSTTQDVRVESMMKMRSSVKIVERWEAIESKNTA